MWSDNETAIDLLQFQYLARATARIVRTPHLLPATIGVFGDWGSGKSSLLSIIRADLEKDPHVMCLSFSGWLFEGYEDAKTALMGTILEAIEDAAREGRPLTTKGRELLGSLVGRVNWLQAAVLAGRYALPTLLGHPHISLLNGLGDVTKRITGAIAEEDKKKQLTTEELQALAAKSPGEATEMRRSIRDFHRDFAALLKETEITTLVVFIDDLDRCLPDTVIETLEAIKLFLFVPGTAFILGADERLIEYAVRQRFPELPGTEAEVGRDYLEKLVQFPIRIPSLSGAEIESYINLLFASLHFDGETFQRVCATLAQFRPSDIDELAFNLEKARALVGGTALPLEMERDLDLTAQIAPVLTPGLSGNPRRTKRFLNTLILRMQMSEDRGIALERQILAKLMLLEYLKPEFFKLLARMQALAGGRPPELAQIETILRHEFAVLPQDMLPVPNPKGAPTGADKPAQRAKESNASVPLSLDKLPAEVQPWLADAWMHDWLASDPALGGVDLRSYFYVAHDKVGSLDGPQGRLTPAARDVLQRLLDEKEATQNVGLSRSDALSLPDATAVFEALTQRIRQAEALDKSPQKVLFKYVQHRPELTPQLVSVYMALPETKITLATPGQLVEAARGTPSATAAHAVLERWSTSTAKKLSTAAKAILARLDKAP